MKGFISKNMARYNLYLLLFFLLFIIFSPQTGSAVTYFTDNMEGTSNWTADSPWAITTATGTYHSSTKAWTDSPGGYYANNANTSLTMASPVNLASAATPQLVFWHKYQLEALESPYGDHGYVEITTDGTTWTQIASFTGTSGWKREQIDLTPYAGQTNVKIRFRLVTDKTVVMDGWYIDDVAIAELPNAVATLTVGSATSNSLVLSWTQNLDADFASYKIYRSTAPGVTTDSTLVTSITTQTTTTYTNSSLTPGTTYYYKVYIANTNDLYAASKDASGTTIASGYSFPFFDNMENGAGGWTAQSPWAIDTGTDHTGATGHFWSDSPGGASYASNANYALSIKVNLAGAVRPVLKFWQQYAYQLNRDYGFVEVSLNNTDWTAIYSVTGSAQWEEAVIDLTRWASQTIYLRFRTDSDASTEYGGWEIDDVSINEATTNAAWTGNTPYPFTDGFDSETSFKNNWITTNKGKEFVWSSSDGHTTSGAAYLYPPQNIPTDTGHYLVLAKPIDLTASVNPQLSFWHKYKIGYSYYSNYIYVNVSVDGGRNWVEKAKWGNNAIQAAWTKVQIDLTEYKTSKNVLIMLSYWGGDEYYDDAYWYVDDFQVSEGPTAVAPSVPVLTPGNTQHSVTLSWATPSNPDFAQYEIYRSTTAGVTLSSTLIKTITDVSANTYTDSGLGVPGQIYYYRMWVKDTKGLYSSGSTEVSATTAQYLTTVTFPFSDNMESGGNNWSGVSPWAIDTGTDHTGATGHFWSDSPGGASYTANANYALSIKVNLAGAIRPVLRWWQQYAYELNADYGLVEVSLNNTDWTAIYSVTGSAQWEEAVIDLTRWASQTIYLRFRTDSNASTEYGGWEIDDVSINEATTNAAWTGNTPYPFTDGFDSETSFKSNWITTNKGKEFVWTSSDGHTAAGAAYLYSPQNIPVETGHYLVLAKPIDLTASVNPQLSFWHKYKMSNYSKYIYVYVSVDGGRNWIEKSHWSYPSQAAWTKVQIDLTEYKTSKNVLIMLSYWGGGDDGNWYVDDLQVSEGPTAVAPSVPVLTPGNTQHSVTLSWATPSNPDFAQYEIYRSTTAGVTLSSTLIKTITDVSANTYTDSGLGVPGQIYYYRMWVKDTKGLYSSGSTEVSATTAQYLTTVTFPFSDNMESGGNNWSGVSPWAIDTGTDHTGATGHFWSDSPGGASYAANANYALSIKVNLAGAVRPVLKFWQQYAYQLNRDYGFVEVSLNNTDWTAIYSVTGSAQWEEAVIDLTRWASQTIYLRFRTDSDGSTEYGGWEIDDVSINEATTNAAWVGNTPYPFTDGFDSETSFKNNWITTNKGKEFVWSSSDGHTTSGAAYLYPPQNIPVETGHYLVLAKPIDLTASVNPQLSFWHKYKIYYYSNIYVYVSVDGGRNWVEKAKWGSNATQSTWAKVQIDLTEYKTSKNVLIILSYWGGDDYDDGYWYVDDLRIGENQTIPSYINTVSGNNQQGQTGLALQNSFVALVTDSNSQPKPSTPVTFAIASGSGTLSAYSATSDSTGKVSTTLTLGSTPGINTVTASVNDSSPAQSITFSATGYAVGQAMRLTRISGDSQTNTVNLSLPNPFVVKVTDILGNPVSGSSVYFSKVSGDSGATLSITTQVATDNAGLAQNNLILGAATGQVSVSAASSGLIGSPVLFTAYAVLQGGTFGDTDGDGMPDDWEVRYGLNPNDPSDAALDKDSDGLTNLQEYTLGTDPTKADTDGDGMPDGWEVRYGFNPLDASDASKDANNDGTTNLQHYLNSTIPISVKHFSISGATSESMDFYGTFTINGMSAEAGDEVAAICTNNLVCGQFTVTTPGQYGFMHVYKTAGTSQGDQIKFKVWKARTGVEMTATPTVASGTNPPTWTGDKQIANVNLNGVERQTIPLNAGWNLISFSVKNCYHTTSQTPLEPMLTGTTYIKVNSISEVLSSIEGQYEVVRGFDSTGAHTFDPQLPAYSDLRYMAAGHAYWIKMKQAGNLVLSGTRANHSDTLSLHSGWNLVGYWGEDIRYVGSQPTVAFPADATQYTFLTDMGSVFTSITGKYSIIRSFDTGFHTYDPLLSGFNDLRYAGPGYGMWIRMNTIGTLSY